MLSNTHLTNLKKLMKENSKKVPIYDYLGQEKIPTKTLPLSYLNKNKNKNTYKCSYPILYYNDNSISNILSKVQNYIETNNLHNEVETKLWKSYTTSLHCEVANICIYYK